MPGERRAIATASAILSVAVAGSLARAEEDVSAKSFPRSSGAHVHPRGSLRNSRIEFERRRRGHVAFIGGSITEMDGYRPMVADILKRRFPRTEFTFTNAGIASTCSTTGAFRLEADVLSKGPVDLLFVEFAVNDDQDAGHPRRECIRGMEGIVRRVRAHDPRCDIVITHFVNPGMVKTIQAGKTPLSIAAHEEVARRYEIPTIDLASEVATQIARGEITWQKFGGTHPAPFGNGLCAGMIDSLLEREYEREHAGALPAGARAAPHEMPGEPLDAMSYERGRFIDPAFARAGDGWRLGVPEWGKLPGSKRGRFTAIPILAADRAGAELELGFRGTAVGAYVLAGPDAGTVEASVDGGEFRETDLYHHFSAGLHYPRTVMFAADLAAGEHTLRLRVAEGTRSSGHAVRIMQFVAN